MGESARIPLRKAALVEKYPGLGRGHFRITSPDDPTYNCMAYAGGETGRCWHPSAFACLHWPGGAPQPDTLDSWIAAYEVCGYAPCEDGSLIEGLEKIAIYVSAGGSPTHVARQLDTGFWTSKMGRREDIEHEVDGLEGEMFGTVKAYLERPRDAQGRLDL